MDAQGEEGDEEGGMPTAMMDGGTARQRQGQKMRTASAIAPSPTEMPLASRKWEATARI